jgi:hypothetical protein
MNAPQTPGPGSGLTLAMALVWIESCLLALFVLVVVAVGCNNGPNPPSYCHNGGRYSDAGWFVLFGGWGLLGVLLIVATARTRKTGDYVYAISGAVAANAIAIFGWRVVAAFT